MYWGRSKNKHEVDFGIFDVYTFYVKKTGNPYNLTRVQFKNIWKQFIQKVWTEIIENKFVFRMPYSLGSIYIKGYKPKIKIEKDGKVNMRHIAMDFKKSIEYWKENPEDGKRVIYNFNDHTDGYLMKIYWDRRTCNIAGYTKYACVPSRQIKRRLAKYIKETNTIYYDTE